MSQLSKETMHRFIEAIDTIENRCPSTYGMKSENWHENCDLEDNCNECWKRSMLKELKSTGGNE